LRFFTSLFTSLKTPAIDTIKKKDVPQHVAIIMDGSGRWAINKRLPRILGHKRGAEILREIVVASKDIGVKYLTVYSFSTENWQRPKDEVDGLMILFAEVLEQELPGLLENDVKLNLVGDRSIIPANVLAIFENAEARTAGNNSLIFNVAFSYGSRQEIFNAIINICRTYCHRIADLEKAGINQVSKYLYTAGIPDPDLLIRTSGEYRISNFLLWQIAYTELYFTDVLWPDFNRAHFFRAVADYQNRSRRFGKL